MTKCIRCRERPAIKNHQCCSVCAADARRRRMKLYNDRLKQGLCPQCGGKREDPGIIYCRKCLDAGKEKRRRLWDKKKKCEYQHRLYEKRKKLGLCPVCGRDRDDENQALCSDCRKAGRDAYQANHDARRQRAKERYHENHKPKAPCPVCGRNRLRCESCGKMMRAHHGEIKCRFTCTCGAEIVKP